MTVYDTLQKTTAAGNWQKARQCRPNHSAFTRRPRGRLFPVSEKYFYFYGRPARPSIRSAIFYIRAV